MRATRSGRFRFLPGKGACCVLVLLAFVLGIAASSGAGNVRVVGGIVSGVSGTNVSLNGKSYDIQGVPITSSSGRRLSIADVVPGKKADLLFRSGRLRSVLVYDPMVE